MRKLAILALCALACAAPAQDFLPIAPGRLELPGYDSFFIFLAGGSKGALEYGASYPEVTGGMEPRAGLLERLQSKELPWILLDAGDSLATGPHARRVDETIIDLYNAMGCTAMLLAGNELGDKSPGELAALAARAGFPFLAANLERNDGGDIFWRDYISVERADLRIAVIGIVPEALPILPGQPFRVTPQAQAMERLFPRLSRTHDRIVVLTAQEPEEIGRVVARWPRVDVWLGLDRRSTRIEYAADHFILNIPPGGFDLKAAVLRYPEREGDIVVAQNNYPLLIQEFPHPPTHARVTQYYREAEMEGLLPTPEGPLAGYPTEREQVDGYIGNASCSACHPEASEQWQGTAHARAMQTLAARERDFVPECVACHVTGFGAPSGYSRATRSPQLASVGCETCHGPGARHAAAPTAANIRNDLSPENDRLCLACHAPDSDPAFRNRVLERFADIIHESSKLSP